MSDLPPSIRILLLADTHLGFDLPIQPRVDRRRRGHDFRVNFERALLPALEGEADLVVHGGDLFHRSRVPTSLVFDALRSLSRVAESGVPVFLVPGNHERSRIPHDRFAHHPRLHLFRRPGTVGVEVRGRRVALAGFPYQRRIRERFPGVLEETGWHGEKADLYLLCMHHCVEGATVGPADYTFRSAPDVIRCSDLPRAFAAVLSGHIHRHQVLRHDLEGRPLPAPVLYPGSVERTAFAEMGEEKGYLILELQPDGQGGTLGRHRFVPLPARPMLERDLHPPAGPGRPWTPADLDVQLEAVLARAPRDAVLRLRVHGDVPPDARPDLAAGRLRRRAPPEMNLEVLLVQDQGRSRRRAASRSRPVLPGPASFAPAPHPFPPQLSLDFPEV